MKYRNLLLALVFVPAISNAQLNGLINKAKNKVTQRVNNKTDKAIDDALDEIEGKPKKQTPNSSNTNTETTKQPAVASYTKYDFIAGEKILYAEDFAAEAIGELPLGWNTNGTGEVVTIPNQTGKWLRLHKSFIYLSNNTKEFGDNYTIEFDMLLQLKNNGWGFPELSFGVLASGTLSTTDNSFLKDYDVNASVLTSIYPGASSPSRLKIVSQLNNGTYFSSSEKEYGELEKYYGKPVHVAVHVQKERLRIWVNETKAFDVPKAVPLEHKMNQLFFKISHTNYAENDYGLFISNLKIATGLPDTRHKLLEEGKFSTTGILFDVNAAVIKPESFGMIKEIATVLKENPTVKIRIVGHTSSDGDDAANLELSKKRAAAVKELLIKEYGIDAAVIETDGKGETQPVADNKTKEGKAANRRVEFIKL
ncbi:OmpA family protein [Lacibacter cauensis]|uniref:OmpA family protein n=1 Tax=Lacibacter cauensis TaxID=510947 RepID=A0A562SM06_9BACT|nr:OmpA family protein [Lacibacter cauensis]TWI81680.1 OmpA family protein [Lacibacter cauensis]